MGTTQVSIYYMQLQTKYKLLSELIRITDFIQINFHTISLFICVRCTVCSYGTSTAYFVTYVTIRGTMNYVHRNIFIFANLCVCFNTKLHKKYINC